MCGIVGLFIKNQALESQLGALVAPMLSEMTERGQIAQVLPFIVILKRMAVRLLFLLSTKTLIGVL